MRARLSAVRIALVSDCYQPRMGGIESQVEGLADGLRAAGNEVLVITASPGPVTPGVRRLPSPVPLGAPINPWAGPTMLRALGQADVVHLHLGVLAPFSHMGARLAREAGAPSVVTWHSLVGSSPLTPRLRGRWRSWVERGVVPSAVSTVAAHQLADALHGAQVAVLRNGVDLNRWRGEADCRLRDVDAEGSPPADCTPLRVITATRFTARKRPVGLLRMLTQVRAGLPETRRPRLVICGEGPLLGPLRRRVLATSMREWVELPGRLGAAELADLYRVNDLYVAPARHEAFGIAALEAAAAGLPVVAYQGSGVRDIIRDGQNGLMATSDHDMVRLLSELSGQPERLASMADYQRSHPPRAHHWSSVVEDTLSLYQRAIRGE